MNDPESRGGFRHNSSTTRAFKVLTREATSHIVADLY